ncbi:MAG: DUF1345 domain-containing protein [Candidatus Leucobacter sulfamidivorax]|nr:DUF1345 domain-containing protein [Candidatus Leucobacter sulfamidivorax]
MGAEPGRQPTRHRVWLRWFVSLACGVVVAAFAMPWVGIAAGLIAGWAALAIVNVTWTLLAVWPMDAVQTRAHAIAEDPGRAIARGVATVGSVASLAAVVVVVIEARAAQGAMAYLLAGIAVLSAVSSWALIQTDYLLRYARVYYQSGESGQDAGSGPPARGIEFNQSDDPRYVDFAYFSVGLGMTYQVADTNVTRTEVRRIVIAQTLLGYLFGAGILATVINLIAGLG